MVPYLMIAIMVIGLIGQMAFTSQWIRDLEAAMEQEAA